MRFFSVSTTLFELGAQQLSILSQTRIRGYDLTVQRCGSLLVRSLLLRRLKDAPFPLLPLLCLALHLHHVYARALQSPRGFQQDPSIDQHREQLTTVAVSVFLLPFESDGSGAFPTSCEAWCHSSTDLLAPHQDM